MTWLRFWQNELVVDGEKVDYMVSFHGEASVLDAHDLCFFPVVPVLFSGQDRDVLYPYTDVLLLEVRSVLY